MEAVYGVVYLITCLVTGKLYVGQTTQKLAERISQHKCGNIYVDRVIKKYGWSDETFKVEVLEECYSREQLDERERYWIAKLNCKRPNGYNCTDGGDRGFSEEVCMARWEKEKARPPEERGWIRRTRKNVYPILEAELRRRKMKYATLAKHLNLSQRNIERRLHGEVKLFMEEATAIRDFLGLDMPLEELFRREDGFDAEATFSTLKEKWNTYPVLKAILEQKQISTAALAKHLGLSRPTVSRKLQGKVGITPEQKAAIRDFLKVEMPLDELFKRNE